MIDRFTTVTQVCTTGTRLVQRWAITLEAATPKKKINNSRIIVATLPKAITTAIPARELAKLQVATA